MYALLPLMLVFATNYLGCKTLQELMLSDALRRKQDMNENYWIKVCYAVHLFFSVSIFLRDDWQLHKKTEQYA